MSDEELATLRALLPKLPQSPKVGCCWSACCVDPVALVALVNAAPQLLDTVEAYRTLVERIKALANRFESDWMFGGVENKQQAFVGELRALLVEPQKERHETTPRPWRVGTKVGRTIYRGTGPDDLIGVMDTREDAALVVQCVNERIQGERETRD